MVTKAASGVVRLIDMIFPGDTNHRGTLFGGAALAHMDKVAFLAASRHGRAPFVTASSERIDFAVPALKASRDGPIELFGARLPEAVELMIRDQGPGLEPRIFETFKRGSGDDRSGGSGLGLPIANGFADAMQLGLDAANAAGGGACFSLRFDVAGSAPDRLE